MNGDDRINITEAYQHFHSSHSLQDLESSPRSHFIQSPLLFTSSHYLSSSAETLHKYLTRDFPSPTSTTTSPNQTPCLEPRLPRILLLFPPPPSFLQRIFRHFDPPIEARINNVNRASFLANFHETNRVELREPAHQSRFYGLLV